MEKANAQSQKFVDFSGGNIAEYPQRPLELCTQDEFRRLVVTIEARPGFLGGIDELEDHGLFSASRAEPTAHVCGVKRTSQKNV